jgi:hypothetical protein
MVSPKRSDVVDGFAEALPNPLCRRPADTYEPLVGRQMANDSPSFGDKGHGHFGMELWAILGMKLDRACDAPRLADGRITRRPLGKNEGTAEMLGLVAADDDMVAEPAGMD